MKQVFLLDRNVPFDGFKEQAITLGSKYCFQHITEEEALSHRVDTIVLTDNYVLPHPSNEKYFIDLVNANNKILWMLEPEVISPRMYEEIINSQHKYSKIFTFDKKLVNSFSTFSYYPWGTCFIKPEDQRIYNKSKNISIVASSKRATAGQQLRHEIIEKYGDRCDGVKQGKSSQDDYKLLWQQEYRYSIAIENSIVNGYFTEKIIDCFRTGVIPIYWGDPEVLDIFNPEGILMFNDSQDIEAVLDIATKEFYESRMDAVKENFEIAADYLYPWQHLWENGIGGLIK